MKARHNWIISVVINSIILISTLLLTDMVYETNDDYAISCRLTDGVSCVNFVNYFICKFTVLTQKLFPSLNMYVVLQILFSLIAFICIFKLILDRTGNRWIRIISAAMIVVYSVDHYTTIQFTKTAALLFLAGLMILIDSITSKKSRSVYFIVAIVLIYIGVSYRIDGFIAGIGFAGLFLLEWLWENRHELVSGGYLEKKRIVLYCVLLALIGGCYGYDALSGSINTGTDELKTYKAYSISRSSIVDYPTYEYYDSNKEAYDNIGISENDLFLIDHWYLDYDGAASQENLDKIIKADNKSDRPSHNIGMAVRRFIKGSISSVKRFSFTGIHIILLVVIAFWILLSYKPKYWPYVILVGVFTIMMYLALYYVQRPLYRGFYVADISATFWLLYMASGAEFRTSVSDSTAGGSLFKISSIIVLVIIAAMIIPSGQHCRSMHGAAGTHVMPQELSDYIHENDDCFFVCSNKNKYSENYTKPWLAPDTYGDRNTLGTGSWGTMSPYILNKLAAYELGNPISGLIDNPKAYYVGDKFIDRLEEYYNKWYAKGDSEIHIVKKGSAGGCNLWQVVSEH